MQKQKDCLSVDSASTERASQVFYAAPKTIARILCLLLLFAMAAVYTTMFFLMPVSEALALLPRLAPLVAIGIIGEVGLAFLISRFSPIRIDEAGITLTTLWGRKRTLLWSEVESVQEVRYLFVSYLKVSPCLRHRVGTLIIPRAVTRPGAFRESIFRHAPSTNPIRRFLKDG
ncbi:MAG: hypothetical protein QM758_07375 [Armatimonas sp.]